MDISTATTFASGLVGLIVPAFVQAFKKYIPSGYVGFVSLAASILFGTIAIIITSLLGKSPSDTMKAQFEKADRTYHSEV